MFLLKRSLPHCSIHVHIWISTWVNEEGTNIRILNYICSKKILIFLKMYFQAISLRKRFYRMSGEKSLSLCQICQIYHCRWGGSIILPQKKSSSFSPYLSYRVRKLVLHIFKETPTCSHRRTLRKRCQGGVNTGCPDLNCTILQRFYN